MKVSAPAKINLSLEIRGKRPDGFHEIETLMVPISLADELEIERLDAADPARETPAIEFSCDDPTVPADDTNLVVRAAKLFCNEVGVAPSLKISLAKKVPHGAGLGGGSSDASATLLALDEMLGTRLGSARLGDLAARLGSDIPFFLHRSAAVCRGRGEIVEPADFPHTLQLVLIKPPFGVPTPWAYKQWRDSVELPGVDYGAQNFPWGRLVNDLERPVFEKYIFLAALKRWLFAQPQAAGAMMSGSGSTMFAVARDEAAAGELAEKTRAEFGANLWICVCRTSRTAERSDP
jgi:4-diphosphocytidyl-2-C-methyl-D-erythritol kinase